jgi:hypothetical protein
VQLQPQRTEKLQTLPTCDVVFRVEQLVVFGEDLGADWNGEAGEISLPLPPSSTFVFVAATDKCTPCQTSPRETLSR